MNRFENNIIEERVDVLVNDLENDGIFEDMNISELTKKNHTLL